MGSKKYAFNVEDMVKLGKNALLVGSAASLTYLGSNLSEVDLGSMGLMVVPTISVSIESAIKWLKDGTKEDKSE
jgi:hypothetical protein